jgi:tetratricopeptide (TPR) repeat protein
MPTEHGADPHQPARSELDRILAFLDQRKLDEAERAARALVQSYPASAVANFALARVLADKRDDRNAINHARQAVQIESSNVDYLTFLGVLYNRVGAYELAGPLLRHVLECAPASFAGNWGIANYYLAAANGPKAISHYEKALALATDSGSRLNVLRDYARCLVSAGETEQAESVYAELARTPQLRVRALAASSLIRRHTADSAVATELRNELARAGLATEDRSILLQALGRIAENSGRYDEAFALWQSSRALLKVNYRREVQDREIAAHTAFYTPALFDRMGPHASPSEVPVFVVGLPRSGTSLTEQIIASHPLAAGVGELRRMYSADHAFLQQFGPVANLDQLSLLGRSGDLKQRAGQHLGLLRAMADGCDRIVDKNPINFMALGYIHLCFPKARIIHCSRQAADNFVSAFQNQMNQAYDYTYDQAAFASYYRNYQRVMDYWKSCFGERIFTLQYESLTAQPESVARQLMTFLDLPWTNEVMRFHERQSTVAVFSATQVRQPIYRSSVDRWKNYEKHLGTLLSALAAPPS